MENKEIIKDGENVKDAEMISVLMIGQSNMSGRGDLGEVPEIINPDCYMLRMGRWQPLREPVNVDRPLSGIPFPSGVSMASSFADGLAKHTGLKVGMIPCADGGTKVEQWQPGEILYDHAVMQCRLAMRTSRLAGVIWHQGESDSGGDPEIYRERLIKLFTSLRADLGNPELPIVAGEISPHITAQWFIGRHLEVAARMNEIYHSLENELPRFAVASTRGLALRSDGIHFSAASQNELGLRYLEKYINICK